VTNAMIRQRISCVASSAADRESMSVLRDGRWTRRQHATGPGLACELQRRNQSAIRAQSACNQRAISMQSTCDSPRAAPKGRRCSDEAIRAQSERNQSAISMQFTSSSSKRAALLR
jgi:hypothetical protein